MSPSGVSGLGSSDVHLGCYPDTTASSNHSCIQDDAYYINNNHRNQAVQEDWALFFNSVNERNFLPIQVSNPKSPSHQRVWPVNYQGVPTCNTDTTTSANYLQGHNLGQQDSGIDTNSSACGLQNLEAHNYLNALETTGGYFRGQQLVDKTIDPRNLEQIPGPGLDNDNELHQDMDIPTTFEGNQFEPWRPHEE